MAETKIKQKQKRKRPKLLALGVSSNKFGYDKPNVIKSCAELEMVFPYHQVASVKQP